MSDRAFLFKAGLGALIASTLLYSLHYVIYNDAHHIFIYLLGDIAFMPLEVFLVVIVIERLLAQREKKALQSKLNMVVGSFFIAVGNRLLADLFPAFSAARSDFFTLFRVNNDWKASDFSEAKAKALDMNSSLELKTISLPNLKAVMASQRTFLLSLMESPSLLERETFSELLWSITHLVEELEARPDVSNLGESDIRHLEGDVKRFYGRLITEWLTYAEHLKQHYPYFFSLLVRTQPFQPEPSATVKG
jgi:hypothetical protein